MAGWAMVQTSMWRDPAFRELSTEARLLFVWSWTNEHAAICGLYTASERQVRAAIGESANGRAGDVVALALEELGRKPLLAYDFDAEVLWVVNRAAHANRSPKTAVAMRREYERCPPSPLRDAFAARYGHALNLGGT